MRSTKYLLNEYSMGESWFIAQNPGAKRSVSFVDKTDPTVQAPKTP
jgi:hypothetical protein